MYIKYFFYELESRLIFEIIVYRFKLTTSGLFYRYTWAMDTGRLSLTLCEAIVEEHSQPEEVNLSNSNLFEVIIL